MPVLLDTHLLIWWQTGHPKLPKDLVNFVQTKATQVFISQASFWEVAIKTSLGKINIDVHELMQFSKQTGFSTLSIDDNAILNVANLPQFKDHKDPFDRMLIAQSQANQLTLLTVDEKMTWYDANVLLF